MKFIIRITILKRVNDKLFKNREVSIDICDVMGRKSTLLFQDTCNKQLHKIQLKKPNLKAGLYVIRLAVDGRKVDAKRVLIP